MNSSPPWPRLPPCPAAVDTPGRPSTCPLTGLLSHKPALTLPLHCPPAARSPPSCPATHCPVLLMPALPPTALPPTGLLSCLPSRRLPSLRWCPPASWSWAPPSLWVPCLACAPWQVGGLLGRAGRAGLGRGAGDWRLGQGSRRQVGCGAWQVGSSAGQGRAEGFGAVGRLVQIGWAAWCGVVWCGVVWRGVAWRGVAWRGVAWRGVVWCGWQLEGRPPAWAGSDEGVFGSCACAPQPSGCGGACTATKELSIRPLPLVNAFLKAFVCPSHPHIH